MGEMADWILDNIMEDDRFRPHRKKKRKTRSDKGKSRKICDCDKYDYCRIHGSKP